MDHNELPDFRDRYKKSQPLQAASWWKARGYNNFSLNNILALIAMAGLAGLVFYIASFLLTTDVGTTRLSYWCCFFIALSLRMAVGMITGVKRE